MDGDKTDRKRKGLTRRQLEIVRLAAAGYSSEAIAVRLGLRYATVKNALHGLYLRLGVQSRCELLIVALHRGWVSVDEVGRLIEERCAEVAAVNRVLEGKL